MEEPQEGGLGLKMDVVFPDSNKRQAEKGAFLLHCLEPKSKTCSTVHLACSLRHPRSCHVLLACTDF